jgi:hypothetical protein
MNTSHWNTSHLVAALLVLWVVGVLIWFWFAMVKGAQGVSSLQTIRIRIAVVIGGLVSILLLYANAMLSSV